MAGAARAASDPSIDADKVVFVEAIPPAPVPIVPLPPAVMGSAVSVLLTLGIRYSKHRKWVTLR